MTASGILARTWGPGTRGRTWYRNARTTPHDTDLAAARGDATRRHRARRLRQLRRYAGGLDRGERDRLAVREHGHLDHGLADDHRTRRLTTSTTSPTTATSGEPPCTAASLSLSFLGQQGGMGHGELGFALRNTGNVGCRTYGCPGVLFLDQSGNPLPTIPHHTTTDFFGSSPAVPLVIAPGASASFRLDVGHGVATSAGCATAYGLQVIPPNDTATLRDEDPERGVRVPGRERLAAAGRGVGLSVADLGPGGAAAKRGLGSHADHARARP